MYKLGKLDIMTNQTSCIIRISDNTSIPLVQDNTDYQAYLAWVLEGNEPLPAEE
jgi:hypothetical protein